MKKTLLTLAALLLAASLVAQAIPAAPAAPAAATPAAGSAGSAPATTPPAASASSAPAALPSAASAPQQVLPATQPAEIQTALPTAAPQAAPSPQTGPQPQAVKAPGQQDMAKSESARYVVYSETGAARAAELDARLEALFDLYGRYFHFDQATLPAKLRVREFKDKMGFDAYISQVAGQTKDDFVYLHYANPERSELVLYAKEGPAAEASLAHQAFVQYLKGFVRNPPLWLRDGFAVFFETARWNAKTKTLDFAENLAWLETAKALDAKMALIPLPRLLTLTSDESRTALDVFYPEAWAFASFLVNSGSPDYNRLLWDSISALKRDASLAENQDAVARLVDAWYGKEEAEKAFLAYLAERRTFAELISEGVGAYGDKAWERAQTVFESAAGLDPTSYIPPYYLGLIAYASGDYTLAEYNYRTALELGCNPATTNYALGVNAFAQNRMADAKAYLQAAKAAAPEKYSGKVDELLKRLGM